MKSLREMVEPMAQFFVEMTIFFVMLVAWVGGIVCLGYLLVKGFTK
jgi:hypothetical protein